MLENLLNSKTSINEFFDRLAERLQDEQFKENCKILINDITRKNIYLTGIGKNQPIAEKTANMLRSLGFVAHNFDCVNAMHGDLGVLKTGDVLIAISKSGNTAELTHMLKYVKENFNYIKTIGVSLSGSTACDFDNLTKVSIKLPEVKELDSWNKVPTTSNIVFQLFFDAISMEATKSTGLTLGDFVKSHPGGMIGQTFKKNH